jgi:hypothetical protein
MLETHIVMSSLMFRLSLILVFRLAHTLVLRLTLSHVPCLATFICNFSCVLPCSCLCSQLHLQEFRLLGEANSCVRMLATNGALV